MKKLVIALLGLAALGALVSFSRTKETIKRTTAAKYIAKLAEYVVHIHAAATVTTAIWR